MSDKLVQRLQAIDALRGLVILLMLLDHVRETFFLHKQLSDPTMSRTPIRRCLSAARWRTCARRYSFF